MDIQAKTSTKSALQKELIDLMKKLIPLHSVYVIGVNKEKKNQNVYLSPQSLTTEKLYIYTLLIITHKPISKRLGDLMDDLYNKMQQRCKVYLITYTLSRVKKQLNYGDNFLSQVVFHTSCIYKADDSLSKFRNFGLHFHSYAYKGIQKTWKGRMDRAAYLLTIFPIYYIYAATLLKYRRPYSQRRLMVYIACFTCFAMHSILCDSKLRMNLHMRIQIKPITDVTDFMMKPNYWEINIWNTSKDFIVTLLN